MGGIHTEFYPRNSVSSTQSAFYPPPFVDVAVGDGVACLVAGGRVGLAVGVAVGEGVERPFTVGVASGDGAWAVGVANGERRAGPAALGVVKGEGTFAVAVGVVAKAVAVAAGNCINNLSKCCWISGLGSSATAFWNNAICVYVSPPAKARPVAYVTK